MESCGHLLAFVSVPPPLPLIPTPATLWVSVETKGYAAPCWENHCYYKPLIIEDHSCENPKQTPGKLNSI